MSTQKSGSISNGLAFRFPRLLLLSSLLFEGGTSLGQLRENSVEVADNARFCHLEDRRFGVLVHRNDELTFLHAGEVLDGTGDAAGKVYAGANGFTGLSDLLLFGKPARVDDGA